MKATELIKRIGKFSRLTLALLALAPAPALAAFSSPVTLSAAHHNSGNSEVAIDGKGNALVVWQLFDGTNFRIQARSRSATGVLGPVLAISNPARNSNSAVVAEDAKGNALIVWPASDGINTRIQARTLSAAGLLGPIVTLSAAGENSFYPAVAINATGTAIIVWSRADQIQGRVRAASGALTPVQSFSAVGGAAFPKAAITATGDAIVVWPRLVGSKDRVELRARSAAGLLKPIQTISSLSYDSLRPDLALDGKGNALVVWYSFIGSKFRVEARARTATGVLSAPQAISAAGVDGDLPEVREQTNGNALIVWETKLGGGILARTRSAVGSLGPIETISSSEKIGAYMQVGMQTNGDTLIAWEGAADFSASRRVKARIRSTSGALGPIQILSANGADAALPAVAVKPSGGGIIAWQRSDGSNTRIQMSVGP